MLADEGFLPPECLQFRKEYICCFDIESLEEPFEDDPGRNLRTIGIQKLVSVAIADNQGRTNCFVRKSSSPADAKHVVECMVKCIEEHLVIHRQTIPAYFTTALRRMEELASTMERVPAMKLQSKITALRKYIGLDVYGFNSGLYYNH